MTQEEPPTRKPPQVVESFDEIAEEFMRRISRIVWCTVATVDERDRPRTRILHPIWEGTTGYIATGPQSPKAKHLAHNPHVSLTYWDQEHQQVYVEATTEWVDDAAEKQRIWDFFKNTPAPLGYDPGMIWQGGPQSEEFGVLKLTPWRIELWGIAQMIQGTPPQIWRA